MSRLGYTDNNFIRNTPCISITLDSTSNPYSVSFPILDEDNYPSGIMNYTKHVSNGIQFDETRGQFEIEYQGAYLLNVSTIAQGNSSNYSIRVELNGATNLYYYSSYLHSAVDPLGRSIELIYEFEVGDRIIVYVLGSNVSIIDGTTVSMHKL